MNEAPDSGPVKKLEQRETLSRVGAALEGLPEREREALRLKLDAGLSYKEIAEVMGLAPSNVGFILHSALKRIQRGIALLLLQLGARHGRHAGLRRHADTGRFRERLEHAFFDSRAPVAAVDGDDQLFLGE